MPALQRKCTYGGLTLDVDRHYIGSVTATKCKSTILHNNNRMCKKNGMAQYIYSNFEISFFLMINYPTEKWNYNVINKDFILYINVFKIIVFINIQYKGNAKNYVFAPGCLYMHAQKRMHMHQSYLRVT